MDEFENLFDNNQRRKPGHRRSSSIRSKSSQNELDKISKFDFDKSVSSDDDNGGHNCEATKKKKEAIRRMRAAREGKEYKPPEEKLLISEVDYKADELLIISDDIYNLTIAANMTKNCTPVQLRFCIGLSFLVFSF